MPRPLKHAVSILYHIKDEAVRELYVTVGSGYEEVLILVRELVPLETLLLGHTLLTRRARGHSRSSLRPSHAKPEDVHSTHHH
jgi:hypothetical protein